MGAIYLKTLAIGNAKLEKGRDARSADREDGQRAQFQANVQINLLERQMVEDLIRSDRYVAAEGTDFWTQALGWLAEDRGRTLTFKARRTLGDYLSQIHRGMIVYGKPFDESRRRKREERPDWMRDSSLLPKAPPRRKEP